MSRYDSIKTATDLIMEVRMRGLSTSQDDLNRAADIFGRASIGELAALANDIGRKNEKGEPDPNGTWSSGRKGTQQTFYFIAFNIWHWEEATRFFNTHTNIQTKGCRIFDLEQEAAKIPNLEQQLETCKHLWQLEEQRSMKAERKLAEAQSKITALKAKLYDLMTVGA